MRALIRVLLLLLLALHVNAMSALADPWSHKGYVSGHVLSSGTHYSFIDMGYAHRVKPFQEVAIFRSRNKVYHPIGVFRIDRVDATKCVIRQSRETPVKTDDLVLALERDLVPLSEGGFVEEHFVRTHIINRRSFNGYDTGLGSDVANAFRTQSHEIRNRRSAAWEAGFKRIADEKREVETDSRRLLIAQLEYFREEAKRTPRSFASVSRAWKQVVILLEPRVTLSSMAPSVHDQRIRVDSAKFAPELDEEAGELIAFMIGKGVAATGNQEAAIRATFKNSQYPTMNLDDRLPKAIATYIQEFVAAHQPGAGEMPQ